MEAPRQRYIAEIIVSSYSLQHFQAHQVFGRRRSSKIISGFGYSSVDTKLPRLLRKSRTSSPSRAKKIRVFSLLSSKTHFIISTCSSKSSTIRIFSSLSIHIIPSPLRSLYEIYLSFGYRFPHIPPLHLLSPPPLLYQGYIRVGFRASKKHDYDGRR